MQGVVELNIFQFSLIYLLLIIVLLIMKKAKIDQTKLLLVASFRMTVQLVLAGFVLTYILENPHPIFVIIYIVVMVIFSAYRVLSKNQVLNNQFKLVILGSIALTGVSILIFFVVIVVAEDFFNPQYTIPIAGMIIGNVMTGLSLGLKTFSDNFKSDRNRIEVLLNLGVHPRNVLLPLVNNAIEVALLPTINSMLGMGIISLPGMMTGQILSGTRPTTAIMYQIAIMIALCAATSLSVFLALNFGYKTLYNNRKQIKTSL